MMPSQTELKNLIALLETPFYINLTGCMVPQSQRPSINATTTLVTLMLQQAHDALERVYTANEQIDD